MAYGSSSYKPLDHFLTSSFKAFLFLMFIPLASAFLKYSEQGIKLCISLNMSPSVVVLSIMIFLFREQTYGTPAEN